MSEIWVDKAFWGEFIDIYKCHPCLWNVKTKMYSDRNAKNKAYEVLIEKLKEKCPEANKDMVIKKLNNMRTVFRKELKKVEASKKSGTGTDDVYEPSLWYYHLLSFLNESETPRPSVSNVQEVRETTNIHCIIVFNENNMLTETM